MPVLHFGAICPIFMQPAIHKEDCVRVRPSAQNLALLIVATLFSFLIAFGSAAQAQFPIPTATPGTQSAEDPAQTQDALNNLLEVLKDDQARQALTEMLEQRLEDQTAPASDAESVPSAAESIIPVDAAASTASGNVTDPNAESIGEAALNSMQRSAAGIRDYFVELTQQLTKVPERVMAFGFDGLAAMMQALWSASAIIILVYAIVLAFRFTLRKGRDVLINRAAKWNIGVKLLFAVGAFVVNVIAIFIAFLAGAFVAGLIQPASDSGETPTSLFLAAFILVEIFIAAERAVLMPAAPWARLLALSDWATKALSRHFRMMVHWLGYGTLFFVPVVDELASFAAGRALLIYFYVSAIVFTAFVVLYNRKTGPREPRPEGLADDSAVTGFLRRNWHWPVLFYLAIALIVVLTRPPFIVRRFLDASFEVAFVFALGAVLISFLSRSFAKGVTMPSFLTSRLPALQRRVNAIAPKVMSGIQFTIVLAVGVYTLDRFEVIRTTDILTHPVGSQIIQTALDIGIVLLIAAIVMILIEAWIDFRLNPSGRKRPTPRERTLLALFRNAATVILIAISGVTILSGLGVNMAPLLASAGIVGIAIGFGAQKLMQDVITGLFIQVEGAIDVGDVINVAGIGGVVERLTIRSVALRDLQGVYHIVPFSSVDTVSNYMRGYAFVVSDQGVAYREDVDEAKAAIFEAFAELKNDEEIGGNIIGELEWMGVDKFGASEVILRSRIKTLPGKQWDTSRAFNAMIKKVFDARGIEIPFPHRTLVFGEDKKGRTQAMHVVAEEPETETPAKPAKQANTPAKQAKAPAKPRTRKSRATKPSNAPDPD